MALFKKPVSWLAWLVVSSPPLRVTRSTKTARSVPARLARTLKTPIEVTARGSRTCVTPVSYTHLDGSGFNVNLPKRTQKDGSWVHDLWFGSATEVSDMFLPNIGANAAGLAEFPDGADAITFDWDAGNLCGRFESNKKVWWRYTGNPPAGDPYLHRGLLRIGSDSKNIAESYVTECGDAVPWRAIQMCIRDRLRRHQCFDPETANH